LLIIRYYLTLFPCIIAGIVNSFFCKSKVLEKLRIPIDGGKKLKDGQRIFGENKTIKGLLGYVFFNIIFAIICGFIVDKLHWNNYNFFYINHENTILGNLLIGFLLGLAYALFELPNSFLKRRLKIAPGKQSSGWKKWLFTILDQADSVFGVALVVCFYYNLGIGYYLLYVCVGAVTHIIINMLLYFVGARKNMF
jgi:CDP-diglyceride synthetase